MHKKDYGHEVRHHGSTSVRIALVLLGTLLVALGIAGIFIPVLPTTPLLLLAAACYARSSIRFYNWIMNNKYFGPAIRDWRKYRSIPKRAKYTAMVLILATFGSSILFLAPRVYLQLALGFIGISLLVFMQRIPVREKE